MATWLAEVHGQSPTGSKQRLGQRPELAFSCCSWEPGGRHHEGAQAGTRHAVQLPSCQTPTRESEAVLRPAPRTHPQVPGWEGNAREATQRARARVTPGHGAGTAGAGLSPCRWCPQTQSHFPGRLLASSQPLDTSPGGYGFQERGKQSRRKGPEPPAPGSLNQLRPGLICTSELM